MTASSTYTLSGVNLRVAYDAASLLMRTETLLQCMFHIKPTADARTDAHLIIGSDAVPAGDSPGKIRHISRLPGLDIFQTQPGFYLDAAGAYLDIDAVRRRAVAGIDRQFWYRTVQRQRDFFLSGLLLIFRALSRHGLHANGVAVDGRGYIIIGDTHHGKTTLSLALVREGWRYIGDDMLILSDEDALIRAQAFRRGFAATPATVRHFPRLGASSAAVLDDEKQLLSVEQAYPDRFQPAAVPRLLLFPEITTERRTRLIPLGVTAALPLLMRASPGLSLDRAGAQHQMGVLRRLAQQARSYRLMLGGDVYDNAPAVSTLLRSAG